MRAIGIDIGTTTISIIMVDGESGNLLGSKTIAHQSFLESAEDFHKIQDTEKIWNLTKQGALALIEEFGVPDSIGMTGQMHGMLYVDAEGNAVSPLYTWQDGSGNEALDEGLTYAEALKKVTGSAASGYGLTTHFYLQKNGKIPAKAAKMVTISDYIAMKLCRLKTPVIARDMAASWGCFDLEKGEFCVQKLKEAGVDISYLPEVLEGHGIVGKTAGELPEGIPVAVSLGDNQASILGSVQDLEHTVLVNIGTGSQVSFGIDRYVAIQGSIELRPCTEKLYIMAGSGLCGGRAYAMLEQFYRKAAGRDDMSALYGVMEQQAREFLDTYGKENVWNVKTTFAGTRSNPGERGSMTGIGIENFHPGAMTVGVIQGILGELYGMYEEMCQMTGKQAVRLVGSGNGIRQNALMRELAEGMFGMKMQIPVCKEEAAYGAALMSLASAGVVGSMEEMQAKIMYVEEYK
ncbi:MAG: FGGY family carbohydrate kinase [Clostridiales bacterium]|nr:FGGY family carbohydrate kinase [Clostridiales bacterium]MDY4770069.1 FGGY family carbohydrate kinase [Lachnospiraceae bacterium]